MNRKRGEMKSKVLRIVGIIFFILGLIFLLSSFSNITGFVIIEKVNRSVSEILGLVFVIVGILLLLRGGLERKILSKEQLAHLSPIERAFRRKLINLFDKQKPIEPKKIAYLLPQYEKVRKTGEHIPEHNYSVFLGKRGNKEEYFSVDTREVVEVKLGDEAFLLPTHIDIQRRIDRNKYIKIGREEIDWDDLLKHSADILDYFNKRRKPYSPS